MAYDSSKETQVDVILIKKTEVERYGSEAVRKGCGDHRGN